VSAAADKQLRLNHKRLSIVKAYREARGCAGCGETHPAILDLHHRDPADKHPRFKKWGANAWKRLSYADIAAELEKCDVLCANCHRKHHYEEANPE
jgi:hypothetical protein